MKNTIKKTMRFQQIKQIKRRKNRINKVKTIGSKSICVTLIFALLLTMVTFAVPPKIVPDNMIELTVTPATYVDFGVEMTALDIYVYGVGVRQKISGINADGEDIYIPNKYLVSPGVEFNIAVLDVNKKLTAVTATGFSVTGTIDTYPITGYTCMLNNMVTSASFSTTYVDTNAMDKGVTLSTAYTLDDKEDFFALSRIVNGNAPTQADRDRFGGESKNVLTKGFFKVTANVTLGSDYVPIGSTRGHPFRGIIDGQNKIVVYESNDFTPMKAKKFLGVVGCLSGESTANIAMIRNLSTYGLSTASNDDDLYMGGIAGYVTKNCLLIGNTSQVSINADDSVIPAGATGTRSYYVGGISGYSESPIIHGSNNKYISQLGSLKCDVSSKSRSYVGGFFGYVLNSYLLSPTVHLQNSNIIAESGLSAYAGGIAGGFGVNAQLGYSELCIGDVLVQSTDGFSIVGRGIGDNVNAYAGGIVGSLDVGMLYTTFTRNCILLNSGNALAKGVIQAEDVKADDNVKSAAGGFFGFVSRDNNIELLPTFSGTPKRDKFSGNITVKSVTNGLGNCYAGGIVGENMYLADNSTIDISNINIIAEQTRTSATTKDMNAGGLSGYMKKDLYNLTLTGTNITVEARREEDSTATGNMYCGGITGRVESGTITSAHVLFGENTHLLVNQNSYQSTSGISALGGIVGAAGDMRNVNVNGFDVSLRNCDMGTAEKPSKTQIYGHYNTGDIMSTKSYDSNIYVGGIVGHMYNNENFDNTISGCIYYGDYDSVNDVKGSSSIQVSANQTASLPSVGGIVGMSRNGKTVDSCMVDNAYILGDSYNNQVNRTDTAIYSGGIIGLLLDKGNAKVTNSTASRSSIIAQGRDNSLSTAGGILGGISDISGSNVDSGIAVINNALSYHNRIKATGQKRWSAASSGVGYIYNSGMQIENLLSIGDTISANNDDGGNPRFEYGHSIAGGIVGMVNERNAAGLGLILPRTVTLKNCYTNARYQISNVNADKIFKGGLIGYARDNWTLNVAGSQFHMQRCGTEDYVKLVSIAKDVKQGDIQLYDIQRYDKTVGANNIERIADLPLDFSNILLDNVTPEKHILTGLTATNSKVTTDNTTIYTINQTGTGWHIAKVLNQSGVGSLSVKIKGYDGYYYEFGDIQAAVVYAEVAPSNPKMSLLDAPTKNESIKMAVNAPEKVAWASVSNDKGDQFMQVVRWVFYNGDATSTEVVEPEFLSSYASLNVGVCTVTIKPDIPIDKPKTFTIQAFPLTVGAGTESFKLTVTIEPILPTSISISRPTDANNVSCDGTLGNPYVVLVKSTVHAYAEVLPTNATMKNYVFNAEFVSGGTPTNTDKIVCNADGTMFTIGNPNGQVYKLTATTIAGSVNSPPVYIKAVNPRKVTTSLVGASFNGALNIFEQVDYKFTISPLAGYGGTPVVSYKLADATTNVTLNPGVDGTYTISADIINCDLTINVEYQIMFNIVFKLQGGTCGGLGDDIPVSVVKNTSLADNGIAIPTPTKLGRNFLGWYLIPYADTEAGYGAPLTASTVVTTSTVYYARWEFGVVFDITAGVNFTQILPTGVEIVPVNYQKIDDSKDYVFRVVPKDGFIGKPRVIIRMHDGVYNYQPPVKDGNSYIYTIPKSDISDGLTISVCYTNLEFISGKKASSAIGKKIPQDGVFTARLDVNHWEKAADATDIVKNSFGFDNLNANRDLAFTFSTALPLNTKVELYNNVNDSKNAYFFNVIEPNTVSIKMSQMIKTGTRLPSDQVTYANYFGVNHKLSETYYLVVTPPYGDEQLAMAVNYRISARFVGDSDTECHIQEYEVLKKRNVFASMGELTKTPGTWQVGGNNITGNTYATNMIFTNTIDSAVESFDFRNKFKYFGYEIFLVNALGEISPLPEGSQVVANSIVFNCTGASPFYKTYCGAANAPINVKLPTGDFAGYKLCVNLINSEQADLFGGQQVVAQMSKNLI